MIPGARSRYPDPNSTEAATARRLGLGRLSGKRYTGKPTGSVDVCLIPTAVAGSTIAFSRRLSKLAGPGMIATVSDRNVGPDFGLCVSWARSFSRRPPEVHRLLSPIPIFDFPSRLSAVAYARCPQIPGYPAPSALPASPPASSTVSPAALPSASLQCHPTVVPLLP